ncbi:hypothetical protein M413DRAFT_23782 [Hebeloma cylindrosporum]|uniref:Uncharacterized protein n=1 Tax=Hebeloma cylindrosporum TaxID=76867 RepID=A0A0C2Y801_HEBCY|nr:hypothetical protein M413DRAFT_23782 [Hebeloma cylindrosporum h7]
MASLPSFVELMASLGLEQAAPAPVVERSPSPAPPSSPGSPRTGSPNLPARSSSSPSLRDMATRPRISRFSPYSHPASFTRRRGSLSSVSSSSDFESSPLSATFFIPARPTSSRPRRYRNKLTINTYGSSSDLNANTPISTYVRRKTPGTSPTSPTFNPDSGYESSEPTAMPFSIPSLPVLLPHSASSESFPNTPTDDAEMGHWDSSSAIGGKPPVDIAEGTDYYRFIRRRTGTRISTPPQSAKLVGHRSRRNQPLAA